MSAAVTTSFAAAITCASRGFPPTSCKTLGCFDLSRVPLPAAMMAMAVRVESLVESLVGPDELFFVDFAVSFVIGFKYTPWHAMRQATCARNGTRYSQPSDSRKLLNCMPLVDGVGIC